MIFAVDPGTTHSAIVCLSNGRVTLARFMENDTLLAMVRASDGALRDKLLAIESIASYGMAVGKETFETCEFCGRLREAAERSGARVVKVYRKDVKIHLCGTTKAKDSNIRQALVDKYGPRGSKLNEGPLYAVTSHSWAALAVADYAKEKNL